MRCTLGLFCSTIVCLISAVASPFAQQTSPTPPVAEETIRIQTEEVHLTVHAQGAFPGVAPKLRVGDLSVFEDGVAQTIASNGRRDEWKKAEEQLTVAAAESGGSVSKSADLTELWTSAAELARAIGMHYSLTYMPTVPATGEPKPRSVVVKSGISGISVRTRKTVVLIK